MFIKSRWYIWSRQLDIPVEILGERFKMLVFVNESLTLTLRKKKWENNCIQ